VKTGGACYLLSNKGNQSFNAIMKFTLTNLHIKNQPPTQNQTTVALDYGGGKAVVFLKTMTLGKPVHVVHTI
jgi:hypothetical protein